MGCSVEAWVIGCRTEGPQVGVDDLSHQDRLGFRRRFAGEKVLDAVAPTSMESSILVATRDRRSAVPGPHGGFDQRLEAAGGLQRTGVVEVGHELREARGLGHQGTEEAKSDGAEDGAAVGNTEAEQALTQRVALTIQRSSRVAVASRTASLKKLRLGLEVIVESLASHTGTGGDAVDARPVTRFGEDFRGGRRRRARQSARSESAQATMETERISRLDCPVY